MRKRLGKKLRFLRRGSRGSAIIVVLVTMTFVVVLASILLYLSLVNIQMKKLDKGGKSNFYSAEAVMDEIRAGVQADVSDAIKEAYSDVLVNYATMIKEEQISSFHNLFFSALYGSEESQLFLQDIGGTVTYNVATLATYYSERPGATIDVTGAQAIQELYEEGKRTAVLLKGISVTYIANGYETTITTDIKISAPPLLYTQPVQAQTPAPACSIIAVGSLEQPAGGGIIGISGSVFAGGLTIGGSGNSLSVSDATNFVLAGPVDISGGILSFSMNSNLWAEKITLDAAGQITLDGDAYIANDLNLHGSKTEAVLSGRYFGYGDSADDPNSSSAILINGRDTKLNMSALKTLLLAGHSFVNYDAGENSTVLMGESISVKPNQLAYLVPESCLPGVTNPYQYSTEDDLAGFGDSVDFENPIIGEKSLSDYGIAAADNIQIIRKIVGPAKIAYICMKFPTTENANAYFKDYFNANSPTIQKYLDLYSNGILLMSSATKNLAGAGVTFNETELGLVNATTVQPASIAEIVSSYNNLCVTMSRTDENYDGAENAYDYFVDSLQLSALGGGTRLYSATDGTPKAVVSGGDYTIDGSTADTVHLVIASGEVAVRRAFSGLIFAGDKVTLYASVTMDSALVSDALQVLINDDDGDGANTYYFLDPRHLSPINAGGGSSADENWNMSALVIYENWVKNED